MSHALDIDDTTDELPVAPSADAWRAMSPAQREAFLASSLAALQKQAELMAEGSPHIRAKFGIRELLGDYFDRIGRAIYLGTELPVHYPDERVFAPDFMAVLDVEDPGYQDTRMAWVVADEGRGLDLALEVTYHGNRTKDLIDNVLTYARLGILEYFIYDRLRQRVLGYRLPSRSSTRYEALSPRGGWLTSRVLGLELGIVDGRLRFSHGGGEVPETRALLLRANARVDQLEEKAEAEARRAADAERLLEEERQRTAAESAARIEAERRADAEATARAAEAAARAAEAAARIEAERRADAEAAARAELERRIAALLAERDNPPRR